MEKFNLTQTGQEVQNILDNATPQSELTAETERAQEAEGTLGEGIQQNATDIDAIEGKIPSAATSENKLTDKEYVDGQVDDEKNRAQGVEGTLQDNIDAEETRAKAAEKQNADDIDALEAVVPSGATSENKLATESYVNDAVATSSATFRGTYNLVSDLHLTLEATHANIATALAAAIATADNNDFAFVLIPTDEETPTVIGSIERYKYNGTDWAYEYTLNNSGFTQAQWDAINSGITSNDVTKLAALPTNAELTLLLNGLAGDVGDEETRAKAAELALQGAIGDEETRAKAAEKANADDIDAIEEKIPSSASSSNQLATASDVDSLSAAIEAILLLIPTAASSLNQLADKAFVNSSIATNTATFRGTFNLVNDLHLTLAATHAQIGTALASAISDEDNNDYCFVQIPTVETAPNEIAQTDRYKFNGSTWEYEYTLNNSGFTSAQWIAINSGITEALVNKLSDLPTNADLTTALGVLTSSITTINQKIPSAASQANQLVDTAAMESYIVQVLDVLTASFNVTSSDGHVTVSISQVDGKITSFALTTLDIASAASLSLVEGRVTTAEGNISTNSADIAILQDAYAALTQSALVVIAPTDTWPVANPATSTIYRVVDRVNTPPQYYSDYMWNGTTMVLMAKYDNAIDPRPKKASLNLVTSGGVFDNMGALDVSELNATENPHTLAQYADLSAALAAIPTDYQKGGMSIKFVQSSDHNYTEYFCNNLTFTTNLDDWERIDIGTKLNQKVDDLLVWDSDSLIYSDINPSAHVKNVHESLKYVYAPDITDKVYVSFYKYTTSGGDVNLGRIRLSKVSDGSQVFINYSNTSIEKLIGGLWDGCYKCWLDTTKYIIVDPVHTQAESTLTTKHFIVNPDIVKFEQEDAKIENNAASILSIQNTIEKDRIWGNKSKVYQITMPNEQSNITLTRAYNMIKDYNLLLTEDCWVYFFQVSHSAGAITNVRIRLHKVSDGSQVFVNYTATKIEQISGGKYDGCYKCFVDTYRYIVINDLYSSIANVEFNDDGTNKWLVAKSTINNVIRICASNSSLKGTPNFDFYCDGYDDNKEIEYALNLIPSGGKIELSDGLFNIGTVQDGLGSLLNRSTCRGITFAGQGRGVTTLKLQPSGLLVDGKDLSEYYNNATFSFNADNQPTLWNGVYRKIKCALFDENLSMSAYTITINGTDKDGESLTASVNRTSAAKFVRLVFSDAAFKTIDSIVFSGVTFSRQPELLRFCLAYENSENNIFRFNSLDNILIEDMTLDGNYENEELAYLSTDSIKNGISLNDCENVTIRNIESSNFFFHGVIGVSCKKVHQTNCILSGNGHRATHYHDGSKNIIFEGNFCKDNGRNHGRNFDQGTSGVFIMYSNDDCIIKNNTIEGDDYCALDIQQEKTDNNSYGRVIVSGNICRSTYDTSIGIQVLTNRTAQHLDGALDGLIISDNIVETKASGILITNAAIKNMTVKGNIVKMGENGYLALSIQGIAADAVDGLSVTGNVVSDGNSVIISNVINAAIVGNVFDATNVSISGNNIVNDNNAQ